MPPSKCVNLLGGAWLSSHFHGMPSVYPIQDVKFSCVDECLLVEPTLRILRFIIFTVVQLRLLDCLLWQTVKFPFQTFSSCTTRHRSNKEAGCLFVVSIRVSLGFSFRCVGDERGVDEAPGAKAALATSFRSATGRERGGA